MLVQILTKPARNTEFIHEGIRYRCVMECQRGYFWAVTLSEEPGHFVDKLVEFHGTLATAAGVEETYFIPSEGEWHGAGKDEDTSVIRMKKEIATEVRRVPWSEIDEARRKRGKALRRKRARQARIILKASEAETVPLVPEMIEPAITLRSVVGNLLRRVEAWADS